MLGVRPTGPTFSVGFPGEALGTDPVYLAGFQPRHPATMQLSLYRGTYKHTRLHLDLNPTYRGPLVVRGGQVDGHHNPLVAAYRYDVLPASTASNPRRAAAPGRTAHGGLLRAAIRRHRLQQIITFRVVPQRGTPSAGI